MIDPKYHSQLLKVQNKLDEMCPSPEGAIISISKLLHTDIQNWKPGESRLARVFVEIDDLIRQIRWHFGQALLIEEIYPIIKENDMHNKKKYEDLPPQLMLDLRELVSYSNQVVFENLEDKWFGGTPAGWIFHMLIDNTMIRLISTYDRIALFLHLISGTESNKIYFRSGKMKILHEKLGLEETRRLFNISKSPEFIKFFIEYRDNIIHTRTAFSRMSGYIPSEAYFENGEMKTNYDFYWDTEILKALVGAGYKILTDILTLTNTICQKIQVPKSF